jgi:hypothetical protein
MDIIQFFIDHSNLYIGVALGLVFCMGLAMGSKKDFIDFRSAMFILIFAFGWPITLPYFIGNVCGEVFLG